MKVIIGLIAFLLLTGCTTLASPSDTNRDDGALQGTVLSGPKPVRFEPNETISVDNLLADRIKGKIKQALPKEEVKVLVINNRIIVSSQRRDNDEIAGQIRKAVGNTSEGRSLVVVTDEVFRLYKKHQNDE